MDMTTIEQVVTRVASSRVKQVSIADGHQSITVTNRLSNVNSTNSNDFTDMNGMSPTKIEATSSKSSANQLSKARPSLRVNSGKMNNSSVNNQSEQTGNTDSASTTTIASTYVGYVQLSPDVASDPLVSVGDTIEIGQTVAYIDVLSKLLPVESKHAGKISAVLVNSDDAVQYGQALFELS